MSGITTTPHLHLQIDKADAPFHAYWPYSFKDLRDLKLDFFEAVNAGLGKENALKYTVSPLDFIQSLTGGSTTQVRETILPPVVEVTPVREQTYIAAVVVPPAPPAQTSVVVVREPLMSAPVLPVTVNTPLVTSSVQAAVRASQAYIDIPARASYARSAAYIKERAIPVLQNESVFRPTQVLTRREAVLYLAGVFSIEAQSGAQSSYADILADDPSIGYLATLQARGVIKGGWIFRPNDAITKQELIAMMLRITGDYQVSVDEYGAGGPVKSFIAATAYSRAGIKSTAAVSRAEAARMMELWGMKRG